MAPTATQTKRREPSIKIQSIPLDSIKVLRADEVKGGYQRELNRPKLQRIVDNFDVSKLDLIVVAPVGNGRYVTPDGQHRLEALRQSGYTAVKCRVVSATSLPEQAQLFLAAQDDRLPLTVIERHRGAVIAGEKRALEIDEVVRGLGLTISRGTHGLRNVGSLNGIWDLGGRELVRDTLRVVKEAWFDAGFAAAFDAKVLRGVAKFLQRFPAERVDRDVVIQAFRHTSPVGLMDTVKSQRVSRKSLSSQFSQELQRIYNVYASRNGEAILRALPAKRKRRSTSTGRATKAVAKAA